MSTWCVILFGVAFAVAVRTEAQTAVNYCCPGGEFIEIFGRCPGSNESIAHRLCPETGVAELFADGDVGYTVDVSNGRIVTRNGLSIPRDRYCVLSSRIGSDVRETALVCIDAGGPESSSASSGIGTLATVVCCLLSIAFLAATLVVYALLPELRDLQGKSLMCSVFSLLMAFGFLAVVQLWRRAPNAVCVALAMSLYFWFLSVFFWLNVVSFHVWQTTTTTPTTMSPWLGDRRRLFRCYNAYGWGGPLLLLLVAVVCHHAPGPHIKPMFGVGSCWFGGRQQIWAYFYGPISVLLLANIVMFVLTAWALFRDDGGRTRTSHRFRFLLYLKLFFVMGVCWTFEPLSMAWEGATVWLVTDYVNALQGVLIFLLLVVFRQRVRRGLARRGVCFFRTIRTWDAIGDEEIDDDDNDCADPPPAPTPAQPNENL